MTVRADAGQDVMTTEKGTNVLAGATQAFTYDDDGNLKGSVLNIVIFCYRFMHTVNGSVLNIVINGSVLNIVIFLLVIYGKRHPEHLLTDLRQLSELW